MKVELITPSQLDVELLNRWHAIQQADPMLDSPFFSSAFTRAVGEERRGVEIAVIEDANEIVGFFPYHRHQEHAARPVAGSFTDFQGAVLAAGATIEPPRLLRACGLKSWRFDHLIAEQAAFEQYHWAQSESPYMDLANGFEAFRLARRKAGSDELQETLRKSRKIGRDVAPLKFEVQTTNYPVLQTLIRWKQEQLRHRRVADCFRPAWVVPMLERMLYTRGEDFHSMLSALYVGDELLATTFGLRSGTVLHGWITGFNPKFRKFSPGLILLTKLAQEAESLGITRIDMGRGDESFKRSFGSGVKLVAEGAIDRRPVAGSVRRGMVRAKELVRATPLGRPARHVMNSLRYAGGRLWHSLGAEDTA